MALTFYKSASDEGGAIGAQLADGGIDDLLPPISSQERLQGVTFYRKIWIESDTDVNILSSLGNMGQYTAVWFETAGENDTIADIIGTERKYAALEILSNTEDAAIVKIDALYSVSDLINIDDYAFIGADIVQIDSVKDNADGTADIGFSPSIPSADHTGTFMSTLIDKAFVTATPVPFWVKVDVPALAPMESNYNTLQFLTVY